MILNENNEMKLSLNNEGKINIKIITLINQMIDI